MAMPKSQMKINKNGIRYMSNVNRASFTIKQLSRAALKDCSKALLYMMKAEAKKSPSLKKISKGKRFKGIFQYWLPKTGELILGIKAGTWYAADAEVGNKRQPQRGILKNTVLSNIDFIRKMQGRYLSQINDENLENGIIDEAEHSSNQDD